MGGLAPFIQKAIHDNPPLPADEVNRLIGLAQKGNKKAIDQLVLSNMRLIRQQASKFYRFVDMDELVNEGVIGFMHAIKLFDRRRKLKLTTYAIWWVRAYMIRACQNATGYRTQAYGTRSVTGIPADKKVSLSQELHPGEALTYEDILVSNVPTPEEAAAKTEHSAQVFKEAAKWCTSPRERAILERMAVGKDITLQACGTPFGVCRERMRQIEKDLKKKLSRHDRLRKFV